jgi:hypothetical protein
MQRARSGISSGSYANGKRAACYDQRLLAASLTVTPEPESLRWIHDVFGNCVAVARFRGRAQR